MKKWLAIVFFVLLGAGLLGIWSKSAGLHTWFNPRHPVIDQPAAVDPIAWQETQAIPAIVYLGRAYQGNYHFKSHLPFAMPVTIVKHMDSDFSIDDQCTGRTLQPQEECNVRFTLTPSIKETKVFQLEIHYALNVVPLPARQATVHSDAHVVGHVQQALPPNVNPGESYPVVFFYRNEGSLPATNVQLQRHYPASFTETGNTCTAELAADTSCEIQGTLVVSKKLTPIKHTRHFAWHKQTGQQDSEITLEERVGVTLSYAENEQSVFLETATVVSEAAIVGEVETVLPSTTSVGSSYPASFLFHNTGNGNATNLVITPNYADGFEEHTNTCGTSLASGASCSIKGDFTPKSEGNHAVGVTLAYAQGQAVSLTSSTSSVQVNVHGSVDIPLPANTNVNVSYPVKFSMTNLTALPALDFSVTPDYPAEFTVQTNTCEEQPALPPHGECEISGQFTPTSTTQPAHQTVALSFSYRGNSDPIPLSTSTTVGQVAISGKVVQGLPLLTLLGSSHPIVYEFRNDSTSQAATGLQLERAYPDGFTESFTNCTNTLSAGATCQIFGVLNPTQELNYEVKATLVYTGGQPVPLTTNTTASKAAITAQVNLALPPNISLGSKHPVRFLLTNTSQNPATAITITKDYPNDFHESRDTCGTSLAAGSSCELFGTFDPKAIGADQKVAITIAYAEGAAIPLETRTNVTTTAIEGVIEKGLPEVSAIDTAYELIFNYHNPGLYPASDLNITSVNPDFTINTNTCTGSLAPGASCSVVGVFKASQLAAHTVGITLAYQGGADIPLTSSTLVGNSLLVAVGLEGSRKISNNGTQWTDRDKDTKGTFNSVAFSPSLERFVIVGHTSGQGTVEYSRDGLTWMTANTTSSDPQRVIWNNTLHHFLLVGNAGIIETSVDGIVWKREISNVNANLYGVVWNEKLREYVVVGANGIILSSPDGGSWEIQQSKVSDELRGIAWSARYNQYLIVVRSNTGLYLASHDGKDWSNFSATALRDTKYALIYVDALETYVALGLWNSIATTPGGTISWVLRKSETVLQHSIVDVLWHPLAPLGTGNFYAAGSLGYLHKSTSGVAWVDQAIDGGFFGPQRQLRGVGQGVVVPSQ